jgi:hypothetical protein
MNCLPTLWCNQREVYQRPFSGPPLNGPFQGQRKALFGAELYVHTDQAGGSSALHVHMHHTHQGSSSSALAVHMDQEGGSSAPKSSTDITSGALSPASKPRAAGSAGRWRPSLVVVVVRAVFTHRPKGPRPRAANF